MEWQPIETAPKDGTVIIVREYREGGGLVDEGRYDEDEYGKGRWRIKSCFLTPTHWMPLQTPISPT